MSEETKPILAWIGTSCPYCSWSGKAEVTEQDKTGKNIVRCPDCGERIPVQ